MTEKIVAIFENGNRQILEMTQVPQKNSIITIDGESWLVMDVEYIFAVQNFLEIGVFLTKREKIK